MNHQIMKYPKNRENKDDHLDNESNLENISYWRADAFTCINVRNRFRRINFTTLFHRKRCLNSIKKIHSQLSRFIQLKYIIFLILSLHEIEINLFIIFQDFWETAILKPLWYYLHILSIMRIMSFPIRQDIFNDQVKIHAISYLELFDLFLSHNILNIDLHCLTY
jgi:hypothetical protein